MTIHDLYFEALDYCSMGIRLLKATVAEMPSEPEAIGVDHIREVLMYLWLLMWKCPYI